MVPNAAVRREADVLVGIPSVGKKVLAFWWLEPAINGVAEHSPIVRSTLPPSQHVGEAHIKVNHCQHVLRELAVTITEAHALCC